jgi:uncharacterized protein
MTSSQFHPWRLTEASLSRPIAIVGRTGSGKSNTAKGLVETLIGLGRRVVVVDPKGDWWGLRLAPDGEGLGLAVPVFGGDHGDIDIDEHAGAALGELLAKEPLSCVLDLSRMLIAEQHRFMAAFAERIYHDLRTPLTLVIDEADEFVPQKPEHGRQLTLSRVDRIFRRGRTKGFRPIAITQRPARLHKDVLAQAATLIAMGLTLPHDQRAVNDWASNQLEKDQQRQFMSSLSTLKKGEGWVVTPEDGVLERVRFPMVKTFDSGKAPEDGETVPLVKLADIDLSKLRAVMGAAIEKAKDEDADHWKAKAKALEERVQLLEAAPPWVAAPDPALEEAMNAAIEEGRDATSRLAEAREVVSNAAKVLDEGAGTLFRWAASLRTLVVAMHPPEQQADAVKLRTPTPTELAEFRAAEPARARLTPAQPASTSGSGPQKILNAVAWWNAANVGAPTRFQVGFIAGYSANGGTFARYMSSLRSEGLVAGPDGHVTLTPEGRRKAARPAAPPTLAALHASVLEQLDSGPAKILGVLIRARGGELGRTAVAEAAGFEASGGTFNRYCSTLKSLQLIRYPKKTTIAASTTLFPEGLR